MYYINMDTNLYMLLKSSEQTQTGVFILNAFIFVKEAFLLEKVLCIEPKIPNFDLHSSKLHSP